MTTARCTLSSCSPTRHLSAKVTQDAGWNEPSSALCHSARPRPARRRRRSSIQNSARGRSTRSWMSGHSWVVVVLFSILICCQQVEAGKAHGSRRLARKTELVVDRSTVPEPRMQLKPRTEHRQAHKHAKKAKTAEKQLKTDTRPAQVSLPHPFDTTLGNNFTTPSCPTFFNNFLNSNSFNECLPFSLLLQTSSGFFAATQSLPRLKQTLDATCNVNYNQCSGLMSDLALEIQKDSACGADFQMRNPVVTQAYNGFLAYQPEYHAGCLTDSNGDYCFANAVTNASAPTSSYIYYLPLGVSLPGGTQPACDRCLQSTMSMFATYAANSSQPLSMTYSSAAEQIDMICGPQFAESSVPQTGSASTASTASSSRYGVSVLTAAALLFAFVF